MQNTVRNVFRVDRVRGVGLCLRISKQSIVNLRKIKSLKTDINRKIRITLQNGEQIVVSRMYSDELRRKLGLR